jgi:hypothetical protein
VPQRSPLTTSIEEGGCFRTHILFKCISNIFIWTNFKNRSNFWVLSFWGPYPPMYYYLWRWFKKGHFFFFFFFFFCFWNKWNLALLLRISIIQRAQRKLLKWSLIQSGQGAHTRILEQREDKFFRIFLTSKWLLSLWGTIGSWGRFPWCNLHCNFLKLYLEVWKCILFPLDF